MIEVYTDGAARGNPGDSASGFMVLSDGEVIKEHSVYNGTATNNYAEYTAVILALRWCEEHLPWRNDVDIKLYSDSELIIRQLNGTYKVKSKDLEPLNKEASRLIKQFKRVLLNNVPRENTYITQVDRNLNLLLDKI